MGRACSMHGRHIKFWLETSWKETSQCKPKSYGSIILKYALKTKYMKVWTGFICLIIGSNGRLF
jgi:hypothetical protein